MKKYYLTLLGCLLLLWVDKTPANAQSFTKLLAFDVSEDGWNTRLTRVRKEGDLLFALTLFGNNTQSLWTFDISNPGNVTLVSKLDMPSIHPWNFEVANGFVYFSRNLYSFDPDESFVVYDYRNPESPSL